MIYMCTKIQIYFQVNGSEKKKVSQAPLKFLQVICEQNMPRNCLSFTLILP